MTSRAAIDVAAEEKVLNTWYIHLTAVAPYIGHILDPLSDLCLELPTVEILQDVVLNENPNFQACLNCLRLAVNRTVEKRSRQNEILSLSVLAKAKELLDGRIGDATFLSRARS